MKSRDTSVNALLGIPDYSQFHPGIDKIGMNCRIHPSVSVMRYGHRINVVELESEVSLYENTRLVVGDVDAVDLVRIKIGARTIINVGGYLSGEGGLEIGADVLIGPHVKILSAGHEIDHGHVVIARNGITRKSIKIGNGSWIGAGATILEGVEIGEGAVVAAGAVVRINVPSGMIVAGVPAIALRRRIGPHFEVCADSLEGQPSVWGSEGNRVLAGLKKWLRAFNR